MKRILTSLFIALCALTGVRASAVQPASKPNVVILFIDDMGYGDIGPFGATNRQTVMTMDFLPTFAKLAGAMPSPGHKIDGANLLPLLQDNSKRVDRTLHWVFGDAWAVRRGAWKLIGKGADALTLMNLENDIEEKNNLINEKPDLANRLLKLQQQRSVEVGDNLP